ncbi:MAG: CoA transferase [Streptosporangiales bacterium]|nr:CoA transferase [Streptosporangiales bacterium]
MAEQPYATQIAKGEDRRQRILDAALPILGRNGARATALSAIAREAGVSTAGLLHHFASKEQMVHAVLDARESSDDAHSDYGGDIEAQLRVVARRFARTPGLVGMFTVLLAENLDPDAPLHERFLRRYRDTCAILGSGIRRGQRAGRYRKDVDPRVKAREVVAVLYGIETSWLLDPSAPVTDMFAEYTRSLLGYLSLEELPRMQPLNGITVVTVEQAISAPICTRHLGDMGARVIKVENRNGGDFARGYDDYVKGTSAHFTWANRNKESVALDLKHPLGAAALRRLVARADVVVQNLAPGAAARLGLDADELRAARPELITVAISGYGKGGPFEKGRAYDLLAQSEGGSVSVTGYPGKPAKPGIPMADIGTGMYALSSVLTALFTRERTGEGATISVGMFDVVTEWMGYFLNVSRYAGFDVEPIGVSAPPVAPYGSFRTKDGQDLVLGTTNDREWQRLAARVLGRPDLASDPRYATNSDRCSHRDELDEVIGAWAATVTLEQARAAAESAQLGHARLNKPSDLLDHPQHTQRDRWREIDTPGGPVMGLLPPPEVDGWEWRTDAVPALGQHTVGVLAELGYTDAEIGQMRAESVLAEP